MSDVLVVYVRQSRKKERTISIDDQLRSVSEWAARHPEVRLVDPPIIEQNVSGNKPWRKRDLGRAFEMIESGQATGLAVGFQDRLSRENGSATAEVWDALAAADARLVCSAEGIDYRPSTAKPDEEMMYSIKSAIARHGWRRAQFNYRSGRVNAIERGVYIGPSPAGYSKTVLGIDPKTNRPIHGPLEIHPVYGPVVHRAFELRAEGKSWSTVAELLTEHSVPTSGGASRWSLKATSKLIENEAYLGVARSGDIVNDHAHPALVSRGLFTAANGHKQTRPVAKGDGIGGLLSGILVCVSCGHRLTRNWNTRAGIRTEFYTCKYAGGCDHRPSINRAVIEPHVEKIIHEYFKHAKLESTAQSTEIDELRDERDSVGEQLRELVESTEPISPAVLGARTKVLEDRITELQSALDQLEADSLGPAGSVTSVELYESLDLRGKREVIQHVLGKVLVRQGRGDVRDRIGVDPHAPVMKLYWQEVLIGGIATGVGEDGVVAVGPGGIADLLRSPGSEVEPEFDYSTLPGWENRPTYGQPAEEPVAAGCELDG